MVLFKKSMILMSIIFPTYLLLNLKRQYTFLFKFKLKMVIFETYNFFIRKKMHVKNLNFLNNTNNMVQRTYRWKAQLINEIVRKIRSLTVCTAKNTRKTSLATKILDFSFRQELSSNNATQRWYWALQVVQCEKANPSCKKGGNHYKTVD